MLLDIPAFRLAAGLVAERSSKAHQSCFEAVLHSYDGERDADGNFQGDGKARYASGNAYTGSFSMNLLQGRGKYTWPDGGTYEGEFFANEATGNGELFWPGCGGYEGSVQAGTRHGRGVMTFEGSDVAYNGEWVHGTRHGHGRLVFSQDPLCVYEGQWVDDVREGQGTMQYASGNVYEGTWRNGRRHGQGTMTWGSREQYSGTWVDGIQQGVGRHTWLMPLPSSNGSVQGNPQPFFVSLNWYVGEFVHGRRHGWGRIQYATGAFYEGQWHEDKKHGKGVFVFEDGTASQVTFQNDRHVLAEGQEFCPGPPGSAIAARLADLLEGQADPKAAGRSIVNVLLRYNNKLTEVYRSLAAQGAVPEVDRPENEAERTSCALPVGRLWALLRMLGLPSPTCPLAQLNHAIHHASRTAAQLESLRVDLAPEDALAAVRERERAVHSPAQRLLFHEFCEALVRMAALALPAGEDLVSHVCSFLADQVATADVKAQCRQWKTHSPGAIASTSHTATQEAFNRAAATTNAYPEGSALARPDAMTNADPEGSPMASPHAMTNANPEGSALACPDAMTNADPEGAALASPHAMTNAHPSALACPSATTDAYPEESALACSYTMTASWASSIAALLTASNGQPSEAAEEALSLACFGRRDALCLRSESMCVVKNDDEPMPDGEREVLQEQQANEEGASPISRPEQCQPLVTFPEFLEAWIILISDKDPNDGPDTPDSQEGPSEGISQSG